MSDEHILTLRQADQARGDLYAIQFELEVIQAQLLTRAYLGGTLLLAAAAIWALLAVLALVR